MEINKKSGTVISLEKASELTHSYQENNPEKPNSYFVGLDKINELLQQKESIGFRIYPGLDPQSNQNNLVLVAVDQNGEDLTSGIMLDELVTCPPMCPKKPTKLIKNM
ncbi:Uncharacterised protein [Myroides odoratimimus]|uniref:hypothetical protein n=1 Tax=Myroides odoratimimus TaxID=76832 RepID=UPI000E03053D|nr:hypothetical protein [Myroides odoratimimus]STZ49458.1 Uncharacterised protein [Myroides odoratimimus]